MRTIPVRKIKSVQGHLTFSEGFEIRDVKTMLGGKDMVQELHRHDFFFILALEKGKGKHVIDFTSYTVGNHSVFLLRPGQVHELTLRAGSTGYLIGFKKDFYSANDKAATQLLRNVTHMNLCELEPRRFKQLLTLLKNVFQEYADKKEGYHEVIRANLQIFFIELARNRQHKATSAKVNLHAQEQVDRLMELLESHVSESKEVSYYADRLNLSGYQLNAITKATLGKTCSELISEYIILESKRYLLTTSNQVSQIAYQLGYEDVSYFIRFFKRHTQYTPEVFRKNFG